MDTHSHRSLGRDRSISGEKDPALYGALASWWPLLSAPTEYAEEAAFFKQTFLAACHTLPCTLLELGSGGGNVASHLKTHFQITLVDRSPGMLAVSRALNPECAHLEGDMRSVRIAGCLFDCVLIHDAIMYLTTEHDLSQAMETCFIHCRPGGAALLVPDYVRETFVPATEHGGHDGDGRSLRYLEWSWDPDPADTTYVADFAYLLRHTDHSMQVEHDQHMLGLFPREVWLRLLRAIGFVPELLHDPWSRDVFVAVKPDR